MIPSSYTYETFSDYLKNEVLMGPAILELGWDDLLPAAAAIASVEAKLETAKAAGSTTLSFLLPFDYKIPAGTVLHNTVLSATATVAADAAAGSKTVTLTAGLSVQWDQYAVVTYALPAQTVVRNPIYASIIDETLLRLGVSDIASMTGVENLRKLRLFGRRECWRMAMQSLSANYDYSGVDFIHRSAIYQHAVRLFQNEEARLAGAYPVVASGSVGRLTESTNVTGVW